MAATGESGEVVLVVDDEESVRRTVTEWLREADWGLQLLTAADSESALLLANDHEIDLAILDWNLGAGVNGLDLLQDLYDFNPGIVAIMITAYADQATPLDAMRRGVRDYLDKNQELTRENFLAAVEKQLRFIRPAKRERHLHQSLVSFRDSVEKILPLVESLSAMNDPVTLPETIGTLFKFLLSTTKACDGVLFVRHFDARKTPAESLRVYDASGQPIEGPLIPFSQSLAASVISQQEPCVMKDLTTHAGEGIADLQPFEKERFSLLAAPLAVAPGIHVVLELFDKAGTDGQLDPEGFSAADIRLVKDAGEFGAEMLRQNLSQRKSHQMLLDAVGAALVASESLTQTMQRTASPGKETPPPSSVLDKIAEDLNSTGGSPIDPQESLRLAEAIRVVALRHGSPAVQHCIHLIESLTRLLDSATGLE